MNKPLQIVEAASIADQALVTLNPENYAAAVYEPFKARLQTAIANAADVTYDIKTKEGMAIAKEHRAILRAIRIDADKERAARKAPITAIGKLLESKYTEIENEVSPYENRFHADIKAEEDRIEAEKAAKLKAEEDAKAEIQAKIDAIKNKPLEVMNKSVADIEEAIAELSPIIPTPAEFGERYIEAEYALKATLDTLASILSGKKAQEQLEAQNRALQEEQAAKAEEAALAAKEQARVDSIKANIQAIKNYIITASECETSDQISKLNNELSNLIINESSYQELYTEALEVKAKTLNALKRQYDALLLSEKETVSENAAAEHIVNANNMTETKSIPEGDGIVNDTISEADFKQVFTDAVNIGTGVMSVSVNDKNVVTASHMKVDQTIGKRPTLVELVDCVATAYRVDSYTAYEWLVTEFSKQAKAA